MTIKEICSPEPLNNEGKGPQVCDPCDTENIQSNFDLYADLDDLDPWSDDQSFSGELSKPVVNQQIKVNPTQSPCGENQKLVSSKVGITSKSSVNDVEILTGSSNVSQRAESVFHNYKSDQNHVRSIHKDDPSDSLSSKGKAALSATTSSNKVGKSKPSKLKLGNKKNLSSSDDSTTNSKPAIPTVVKATDNPPLKSTNQCPQNKQSKIRFNLRVPDFSDSDDDIVFLDKIKPSKVPSSDLKLSESSKTILAAKPQRKGNTFAARYNRVNPLNSPSQNSPACQIKFSPAKSSCSTPLRPHYSTSRTSSLCKDDIHALTPIRVSPEKNNKETRSALQGDWLSKKKKSPTLVEKNDSYHIDEAFPELDEDDLDDFEESVSFQEASKVAAPTVVQKKKQKKPGFIEEEAEVSGDQASSDEDDVEADDYDLSFIDNHSETQGPDMHSMYLKSVKNPVPGGRYKLKFNTGGQRREDIYSQAPEESQGLSEYEEDSFCVGSNEEESEMESPPKKLKKQKIKSKKLKQVSGKRVIRMLESSSEGEEDLPAMPMTQEFHTSYSRKTALLSSDEEMDGFKRKKKKIRIEDDTQILAGGSPILGYDELSQNKVQSKENFTLLKDS
ncbi:hypothetical protein EGW08_007473, partial [Elysia chlorotica]